MSIDYTKLADPSTVERAMEAMRARGVSAEHVATGKEALRKIIATIPDGASVMSGGSLSLETIGFTAHLKEQSDWVNLKAGINREDDAAERLRMRREATMADYFLGSVHAVAETGEVVTASHTGSQLAAYAYSARHVIWVIGTNKIVPTLDDALRRVRDYVVPRHKARLAEKGGDTFSGKQLIVEREDSENHQIHVIFVDEVLGY